MSKTGTHVEWMFCTTLLLALPGALFAAGPPAASHYQGVLRSAATELRSLTSKSWAAAVSGNWGDHANWSPAGVPTAADDVFITVDGTYTVTVNVAAAARSLTLGGAAGTQTFSQAAPWPLTSPAWPMPTPWSMWSRER